jgi:hypothetical protein
MWRAARLAGLAWVLVVAGPAAGDEVTFPLVVDRALLENAFRAELGAGPRGAVALWEEAGGCRSVTVRELHVEPRPPRVALVVRASARLGVRLLGFCLAPVAWDGHLEALTEPRIGGDWQLRFPIVDSQLLDRERQRTVVASGIWDLVKGRVEERIGAFTFDLAPPLDETKAVLRLSVAPGRSAVLLAALETLRPGGVEVTEEGVRVPVALDVPPASPPAPAPEPALAPPELERWQAALERWDGFLVFVIKDLGGLADDPATRDDLLALLLASRHRLLLALAGGPDAAVDPVRQLFLDSWDRLRQIVRRAALAGRLEDRTLRYTVFLTAGDALAALDAAAPALGIEISADGLRRLARILEPEYLEDPLAYSEAADPVLRELFRFHEPATGEDGPPPAEPPGAWWWLGPPSAHAEPAAPDGWSAVARRLDRWVPEPEDLEAYREAVGRLLGGVARHHAALNRLEPRFEGLYGHLVPAVAWQESCWRQFVRRNGTVTYLESDTGDIGIMQVNRRVWRGFFDLEQLRWDIAYNAAAGAEILAQLLTRYGSREAAGRLENAARATYAAYNGGPDDYRRYRLARVPRLVRAIDRAFWDKYQAMAAGQALDFVLCTEGWGRPPSGQTLPVDRAPASQPSGGPAAARPAT